MTENDFSGVIAAAQQKSKDREACDADRREKSAEIVRSKQQVLHTVVHRTLLSAWRSLEAAGVKASVDTGANARGDWQIVLRLANRPDAPALVFSVITGLAIHLVCSREFLTLREEVNYDLLDDATPVEIAQVVAAYLSDVLG